MIMKTTLLSVIYEVMRLAATRLSPDDRDVYGCLQYFPLGEILV